MEYPSANFKTCCQKKIMTLKTSLLDVSQLCGLYKCITGYSHV
jgi:hypothetical protein